MHEGRRGRVQPQPGEGLAVAVRHHGQPRPRGQRHGLVREVDQLAAGHGAVGAEGRHPEPVRAHALADQHGHPVVVALDGEGVEARAAQPELGPPAHVALGGVVERADEVVEGGVPEPVAGQVGVHAGQEVVVAEPGHELAQAGVALGVGDRVEVGEGAVHVGHVLGPRRHRVGGAALVGDVRRGLALRLVRHEGARETGPGLGHPVAHVVGEALVEPGVLPPAHRHEVAEPHVRHLVGDHRRPLHALVVGDAAARQHLVAVGDAAGRLHRAPVVPGAEQLVVGVERVGLVEELRIVVEAVVGGALQLLGVALELGRQRLAGVPAEREASVAQGVLPGHRVPRARAHHEQGRADPRRGRERPPAALTRGHPPVGDHGPPRVGGHRERDRRLEVDLVEAREDPLCDVEGEVRRHVALAVGGVGHRVHPVAVGDVGDPGLDHDLGAPGQAGQRDPAPVVLRLVDGCAVERQAQAGGVRELEEGVRAGGVEADRRPAVVRVGVGAGEVEVDLVGDVGDEGGAGAGFSESQGHPATLTRRAPGCRRGFASSDGRG